MTGAVKIVDCLHVLKYWTHHRHNKPPNRRDITSEYSQLDSIRRVLGTNQGVKKRTNPLCLPLVPQNSFLGRNDDDGDDYDDDEGEDEENDVAGLFDTSIFHQDTDPNGFKLPSVFATSPSGHNKLKRRRQRVVPTVSEKSFLDSNLRGKSTTRSHNEMAPPSFLPHIDPDAKDLVAMKTEKDYHDNDDHNDDHDDDNTSNNNDADYGENSNSKGSRDTADSRGKPPTARGVEEMTSALLKTMTLESEKTSGSLVMDEHFVPMSVTITRLSNGQAGHSPPPAGHRYEDDPSSSISASGSAGAASRDTSLYGSDVIENETSCCTCLDPEPHLAPIPNTDNPNRISHPESSQNPSTSPCVKCLKTDSHEKWCPYRKGEVTLVCRSCGREIWKRKSTKGGRRPRGATNRRRQSGHDYTTVPSTPETAMDRFNSADSHNRRECSGKRLGSKQNSITNNNNHRVHFEEDISSNLLEERVKDEEFEEARNINRTTKDTTPQKGKLFTKSRHHHLGSKSMDHESSVRIAKLGVSVHKMAYDLALRDARLTGAYKKKGKGGSKGKQLSESASGTIFSYFPLLKRPFSENDKLEIGLKPQEGRRVKRKDYMKHIFGNIKINDYYPGGKNGKGRY